MKFSVSFDLETLYILPLKSATTKFLGLPLPPFLKIDVVPELFSGSINQESGKEKNKNASTKTSVTSFKSSYIYIYTHTYVPIASFHDHCIWYSVLSLLQVDLEFKAKYWFSVGCIYKAPPLLVKTVLTAEESKGSMKSGKGVRLDELRNCRLVGVATVDRIDDFLINSFLGLPTECLADLNAIISLS